MIEREFRRIMSDPELAAHPQLVANLMFLVRKRELRRLLPDVERALGRELQPAAEVSALKTFYALGGARERGFVDERVSRVLRTQREAGAKWTESPFFGAAERIGGPRTLELLKAAHSEAAARQREAQAAAGHDQLALKRLDKIRSQLEEKSLVLSRKVEALAMPEPERSRQMTLWCLERAGHLGVWACRELSASPPKVAAGTVREIAWEQTGALLPVAGLTPEQRSRLLSEYRTRGACLLRQMGASLTTAEKKLLPSRTGAESDCPRYDWEDVLDQN
jgi:hypothetical protein